MSKTWKLNVVQKQRDCLERNGKCFYPECSCSSSATSTQKETAGLSTLCSRPLKRTTSRVSVRVGRGREDGTDGTP